MLPTHKSHLPPRSDLRMLYDSGGEGTVSIRRIDDCVRTAGAGCRIVLVVVRDDAELVIVVDYAGASGSGRSHAVHMSIFWKSWDIRHPDPIHGVRRGGRAPSRRFL